MLLVRADSTDLLRHPDRVARVALARAMLDNLDIAEPIAFDAELQKAG